MKGFQALLVAATLLAAGVATAHHSFSMFDMQKEMTITGVVKEFQWTNPHIWIQVHVTDGQGKEGEWSVEGSSPIILARRGWKPSTLKPGDKVSMVVNPLKDGRVGGSFVSVTLPDGRVVGSQGVPAAPAP